MTRISSLFVATTLAILPISAFAQQTPAATKSTAATNVKSSAQATPAPVTAPVAGKTANGTSATMSQPGVKTPSTGAKTEVHGMNTVNPHHSKSSVPAKSMESTKS